MSDHTSSYQQPITPEQRQALYGVLRERGYQQHPGIRIISEHMAYVWTRRNYDTYEGRMVHTYTMAFHEFDLRYERYNNVSLELNVQLELPDHARINFQGVGFGISARQSAHDISASITKCEELIDNLFHFLGCIPAEK